MFKNIKYINLLLIIIVIAVWIWVFIYQYHQKTSFLDDAFIYLNITKNILYSGTAQFFPISDNQSLLASSPLRLLILIPSMLIAKMFTGVDVSIETAKLTFYFSGILSSLIFIPFFIKKLHIWCYGLIFAGLLSLSTETALQMEGILLFWIMFSILTIIYDNHVFTKELVKKIGLLVGLLLLTRPEYGIVVFCILIGIMIYQRNISLLTYYFIPIIICGIMWIIISFCLDVWPIPTTYITKVITAELNKFGPNFIFGYSIQFNNYFLRDFPLNLNLIIILTISYLIIISWKSLSYLFFSVFIIIMALIISQSAGNYLWYYENYFVIILTISFFIFINFFLKKTKKNYLSVIYSFIILFIFMKSSLLRNPDFPWNFNKVSSAISYQNISKQHIKNGLFKFEDLPLTYIKMMEIGIVSYFGNSSIWIYDSGGLAQAGTLKGIKESFLTIFYPKSILIHGKEEYSIICQKSIKNNTVNKCNLHDAWAIYDQSGINKVQYYYDNLKVGLNNVLE